MKNTEKILALRYIGCILLNVFEKLTGNYVDRKMQNEVAHMNLKIS